MDARTRPFSRRATLASRLCAFLWLAKEKNRQDDPDGKGPHNNSDLKHGYARYSHDRVPPRAVIEGVVIF